jgi:hypothetical protein
VLEVTHPYRAIQISNRHSHSQFFTCIAMYNLLSKNNVTNTQKALQQPERDLAIRLICMPPCLHRGD